MSTLVNAVNFINPLHWFAWIRETKSEKDKAQKHGKSAQNQGQLKKNRLQALKQGFYELGNKYNVFFKLISGAGQWRTFAALLLIMLPQYAIPILVITRENLWTQALVAKQMNLWAVGINLIAMSFVGMVVQMLYQLILNYLTTQVAQGFRDSIHSKIEGKSNLVYMQEKEMLMNQEIGADKSTNSSPIQQVLSREVESFIRKFVKFHNVFGFLLFWVIRTALSLYAIGMLAKATAVASVAIAMTVLISSVCDIKKVAEGERNARGQYEQNMNCMMAQKRISANPNLQSQATKNLRKYSKKINKNGWWMQLYNDFIETIAMTLYKSIEPVVMLALFLQSYLETVMSYDILRTNLGMVVELFGAASVAMYFMTEVAELSMYTSHVSRIYNDYLSNQSSEPPVTSASLRAEGECQYIDDQKVLRFTAEVAKGAGITAGEKFRAFNHNGKPLEIKKGEKTVVFGLNGAGKSLFFNVLSGVVPGVKRGKGIEGNSCFSVYCMQSPELQIQRGDGKPWTPMQILTLWWPHPSPVSAENIDEENGSLGYITHDGKESKVSYKDLRGDINGYLDKLGFSIEENGSPSTVESVARNQKDFNTMSGGQKKKLTLAIYLAMAKAIQPRVFLIDEPCNDLDAEAKKAWKKIIVEMNNQETPNTSEANNHEKFTFQETSTFIINHDDSTTTELKKYNNVLFLKADMTNSQDTEPSTKSNIAFFGEVDNYIEWHRDLFAGDQEKKSDIVLSLTSSPAKQESNNRSRRSSSRF